jgi:Fic family protein
MTNFEQYIHGDDDTNLLVRLAIAHYQFETIHPFMDGNGRMGRLLMTLLLCVERRVCVPLLYLSAFFSSYKQKYYDLLLAVSTKNGWTEWIEFFLEGVIETATDAIVRAEKLLDLHKVYRQKLISDGCGDVAQSVLDLLFTYPAYSIPKVAALIGKTYPTVQLATDKLVDREMVELWPGSHHPKIYLSRTIIGILEDTTLLLEEPAA